MVMIYDNYHHGGSTHTHTHTLPCWNKIPTVVDFFWLPIISTAMLQHNIKRVHLRPLCLCPGEEVPWRKWEPENTDFKWICQEIYLASILIGLIHLKPNLRELLAHLREENIGSEIVCEISHHVDPEVVVMMIMMVNHWWWWWWWWCW